MKKQKLSPAEQPPAATPQEGLPTEGKTALFAHYLLQKMMHVKDTESQYGSHSVDQTLSAVAEMHDTVSADLQARHKGQRKFPHSPAPQKGHAASGRGPSSPMQLQIRTMTRTIVRLPTRS